VPSGPSLNGRSRAVGDRPRRGGPTSLSSAPAKSCSKSLLIFCLKIAFYFTPMARIAWSIWPYSLHAYRLVTRP